MSFVGFFFVFLVCALQTGMMLVRKDSRSSHLNVAACIFEIEFSFYSVIFFISLFYSILVALSCNLLRHLFFDRTLFTFPLWSVQRLLTHLGYCWVQKYSCLIKSSYVPGYVCLNWHLAVFSFFDSTPLFNTCSIERWLLFDGGFILWSGSQLNK